ncbi:MAG: hypothetical protein Q7T32_09030 [Moraxellaceae bacterium]|nr:hypothetical protein [Moraxellaceae bacterium]
MSVTRSRLRAHAIEWHVAPTAEVDAGHRSHFLELQRRCNTELCRHEALTCNSWLDRLESQQVSQRDLLASVTQFGIFMRQLLLARQHHALRLTDHQPAPEMDGGPAVVVCFDAVGEPWCPALPNMGIGDPYHLSQRLHDWWMSWQRQYASLGGKDWGLASGWPTTHDLCEHIELHYNAMNPGVCLGVLVAIENALSTDFWLRLTRTLHEQCLAENLALPDGGFFCEAETDARLQARHGLYLLESASVHDLLDDDVFFQSAQRTLSLLARFWTALANAAQIRH